MKFTKLTIILSLSLIILGYAAPVNIAVAATSATKKIAAGCTVEYYYADASGKKVTDNLRTGTGYMLMARFKAGTCNDYSSIELGYLAEDNGKLIGHTQACDDVQNMQSAFDYKQMKFTFYTDATPKKIRNYMIILRAQYCNGW